MTVSLVSLIPAKEAENAQTVQYTAQTGVRAVIDKFTATNTDTANQTISVNLIASGGGAGDSNLIVKTRTLAPNECYTFPELVGHSIMPGGMISTLASAANSITIFCSGRQVT